MRKFKTGILISAIAITFSLIPAVSDGAQSLTMPARCTAFSPYVGQLDPDFGLHPSPALIGHAIG